MSTRLSTTSYAVLGMLGLRSWTPYELTQQMRRSLAYCWPISERVLYNEPERLVTAGLATCSADAEGRRVYSITAAGRQALASWLSTAPSAPRMFNESFLRVLFADQGSLDDLAASLRTFGDEVRASHDDGRAVVRQYVDGGGPFAHRAHLIAIAADLVDRVLIAYEQWTADTLAQLSTWDTTRDLGLTEHARHLINRAIAPDPPEEG